MRSEYKSKDLSEQQMNFISQLLDGVQIIKIMKDLKLNSNIVCGWLVENSLFASALNSSIYLREQSIFIKSINLRSITLDKLKEKVIAGDSKAIELALANQELEPDFIIDRVSSKHLEKRIEQEILYRLDPRQKKIDWPGDNEAPF
tara:strand:+ start:114 stop:551 length:438 start_codon:yes stop_codon:yes gene_type:complete